MGSQNTLAGHRLRIPALNTVMGSVYVNLFIYVFGCLLFTGFTSDIISFDYSIHIKSIQFMNEPNLKEQLSFVQHLKTDG
jgi:hypothetical protein